MTKAEAIKALEIELNRWEADCKSYHEVKEALPMAIEALKNETALINRVSEIIDKHKYSPRWNIREEIWNEKLDAIKDAVMALKGGGAE